MGGLSVYQHIRERLAGWPTVYLADSAGFPYGPKSELEILERVVSLVQLAYERYRPALVVVACNTASTLVLPALRERLPVPVVGVVPAIKTAAAISRTRTIGLLATPGTIAREYTAQLIGSFAPDCRIIRVGSRELVDLAEAQVRGQAPDLEALRAILAPFFGTASSIETAQVDAIVLGCTHFPLLTEALRQAAPVPVQWVDSGAAIARRVEHLLGGRGKSGELFVPVHLALCTQWYDDAMIQGVQAFGFDRVELFSPNESRSA